jgi:hypothetical protein
MDCPEHIVAEAGEGEIDKGVGGFTTMVVVEDELQGATPIE